MGIQDYAGDNKSSKLNKAEELIDKGFDIEIIFLEYFYDLVLSEGR
jgi:hypothetical protein